jgi:hypothetical protein
MNTDFLKKATPYLVAIVVFLAITFVYFSPVLEGKKLRQHDIAMYKGMSKEIADFRESTGEEALWTNSMFGGMPAWQISVQYNGNLMRFVDDVVTLGLPYPANYVFLYFLGFFILLLVLRVNPWVGLVGSIAFALSSYFFIILGAGHTSKAHAIGYMAPVLAGIILTYRGKYWQGALLTAVALALEILSGHLQITYYLLIIVLVYGIYQLIQTILDKNYVHFAKATGILIVAALLAVLSHSTNIWATYDYGQETMRGKPELTKNLENKSGGLDRDYITHWSYGQAETWSFLIPNAKGGASGQIGQINALDEADPGFKSQIAQQNAYWGDQPGTSGPVYIGVIVMFLFVLGLFIVRDNIKWVLLAVTVLSVLLAWGHNLMWFTDLFIDYFPGYNKFRAVTMTLVIAELAIPILAFLALNKVVTEPDVLKNKKPLYISFGLTGGLIFLLYLMPTTFFSFFSNFEETQFRELQRTNDAVQVLAFMDSLEAVRVAIFKADALRSLLFVSLAAALIYLFSIRKLKTVWLIAGLSALIVADMVGVNKRYLNNDNFTRARDVDVPFKPSLANNQILADADPDFRVLDLTTSTFNDASTSYFHKSIGGYHGAKLQRYQDIIDYYLTMEINDLVTRLPGRKPQPEIEQILSDQSVLNMLNTKYILLRHDMQPLPNNHAFGHAWFVDEIEVVDNPDKEIEALGKIDPGTTAIVDKRFREQLSKTKFDRGITDKVTLETYAPNYLKYSYKSDAEQAVVFSEIYYDKGWNAYLNGEEVPYFRANYILRAMVVPPGEHIIEFKFEPRVWAIGEKISFASSLLLILMLAGAIVFRLKIYFSTKGKEEGVNG